MRTPHAGACRTPLANSVYYGIAAATNGQTLATHAQLDAIERICVAVARAHAWTPAEIGRRIVGHDEQAIWHQTNTTRRELWGTLGRKIDPTGRRADRQAVIDTAAVKVRITRALRINIT